MKQFSLKFQSGSKLVKIQDGAFAESQVTSIQLPISYNLLSFGLFQGLTFLETVIIDAEISNIPRNLFYGDSKLKTISVGGFAIMDNDRLSFGGSSIRTVEENSFRGVPFTNITFGGQIGAAQLDSIGLRYNPSLTYIKFSVKFTTFTSHFFAGCSSLHQIDIVGILLLDNGLLNLVPFPDVSLGHNVFDGVTITTVTFNENSRFDSDAFLNCKSLSTARWMPYSGAIPNPFYIPTHIRDIPHLSEIWVSNLQLVRYGDLHLTNFPSVTSLAPQAFAEVNGFTAVNIESRFNLPVAIFEDCDNLEKANLEANYETIPDRAFRDCSKLSYLSVGNRKVIDNGVLDVTGFKQIGRYAFSSILTITSLIIPDADLLVADGSFGAPCTLR